jgi:hypothetical protein
MLREILFIVRKLPQTIHLTASETNKKRYVLARRNIYRLQFISIIYLFNTINVPLFDSITFFPLGLLLSGVIALMVEKASDLIYRYGQRVFGWTDIDIQHYTVLYNCRYPVRGLFWLSSVVSIAMVVYIIKVGLEQKLHLD